MASLGACSGVKKSLGIEKTPPDEFTVVARAPLELPPDYTLRPPRAGALRPQDQTPTAQARSTVFKVEDKAGPAVAPHGAQSAGEAALCAPCGATAGPALSSTLKTVLRACAVGVWSCGRSAPARGGRRV